jgi:hypothetical protein
MPDYDDLVTAALTAAITGWDFSWLAGRAESVEPTWSYRDFARDLLSRCESVLDIDTGGGEVLASLAPLPKRAVATEGWPPNVVIAGNRLRPLGVTVITAPDHVVLPVADDQFDLLLNRHGRLNAAACARVSRAGGMLLTQQVGSDDCAQLNAALGAPHPYPADSWTASTAGDALMAAGFRLVDVREEWPLFTFFDIGAMIYQLRMVPWQIPDFTTERYGSALRRLDAQIRTTGSFVARSHRFLIVAQRE